MVIPTPQVMFHFVLHFAVPFDSFIVSLLWSQCCCFIKWVCNIVSCQFSHHDVSALSSAVYLIQISLLTTSTWSILTLPLTALSFCQDKWVPSTAQSLSCQVFSCRYSITIHALATSWYVFPHRVMRQDGIS